MTLTELIGEYLLETGEPEAKRMRFLQMGISCLREINIDVSGVPKTVRMLVNTVDTVDLPSDYINYVRIGIEDAYGNLHSLGRNDDISLAKVYNNCGDPRPSRGYAGTTNNTNSTNPNNGYGVGQFLTDYSATHFRNGEVTGAFYGIGGGNNQNGYYKIDYRRGQILLQGACNKWIVMEYLADLEKINKDGRYQLIVHPFLINTVKEYINWRNKRSGRSYGVGETEQAKQEYYTSLTNSMARYSSPTYEEVMATYREMNMQAVKF